MTIGELSAAEVALIIGSGLGTALGAVGLLVIGRPSQWLRAVLLGFTGGIMFAAAVFSLLVPALEEGGVGEVVLAFLIGVVLIAVLDAVLPHVHSRLREHGTDLEHAPAERRGWLLLSALTLHNIPEGMAVGVAFAAGGAELGLPVAVAIGIQNVPEGFAAGAPLLETRWGRRKAAAAAAATGLVEPPAAFAALLVAGAAAFLLPAALAFAAGAMIYVVVDELVPESHAGNHEREASIAFLGGFALMMVLDNALG